MRECSHEWVIHEDDPGAKTCSKCGMTLFEISEAFLRSLEDPTTGQPASDQEIRKQRLEGAAESVQRSELEVPTPEELSEPRQPRHARDMDCEHPERFIVGIPVSLGGGQMCARCKARRPSSVEAFSTDQPPLTLREIIYEAADEMTDRVLRDLNDMRAPLE